MDFTSKMSSVMDFSVRRRDAISNNIANQNTDNFKAENVVWKETLEKGLELSVSDDKHISKNNNNSNYEITVNESTEVNSNGNNVDLNTQIVEMMKNNQVYSMSLSGLNSQYEANSVARGGK